MLHPNITEGPRGQVTNVTFTFPSGRAVPEAALRAAIQCSETLGAYGWLHDYPFARFIALAKMLQVVDGSAEIQRLVIARDLVRRPSR